MKMKMENHPQASAYLNCSTCERDLPAKVRAGWNCGLLAVTKRVGPGFPSPASFGSDTEICPGYLISLPQVIEVARARVHWQKGLLKERYEGEELTGLVFDGLELLEGYISELELQVSTEGSK
jgi:hypothetical protein